MSTLRGATTPIYSPTPPLHQCTSAAPSTHTYSPCTMLPLLLPLLAAALVKGDECHLTPVIHVLQVSHHLAPHICPVQPTDPPPQYPGCIPKPIPSFACTGRCTSYVQVSYLSPTSYCHWPAYSVDYACFT